MCMYCMHIFKETVEGVVIKALPKEPSIIGFQQSSSILIRPRPLLDPFLLSDCVSLILLRAVLV